MMTRFKLICKTAAAVIFVTLSGFGATQVGARSNVGQGSGIHDFERLDLNGDGEITRVEVQARKVARFARIDVNNDGKITSSEMIAVHNVSLGDKALKRAAMMIDKFDRDQDGALTAEEMPNGEGKLFERADANGDGAVSQKEFDTSKSERSVKMKKPAYQNDVLHGKAGE